MGNINKKKMFIENIQKNKKKTYQEDCQETLQYMPTLKSTGHFLHTHDCIME